MSIYKQSLLFNTLSPSVAIWSTLAQFTSLTAPNNFLNQCGLFFSEFLVHSPEIIFTTNAHAFILYEFEN